MIDFGHLLHAWSKPSVHQVKRVVPEEGGKWYFPMQRVYQSKTRMMGEARARAIADIEMRRESQAIEFGERFDMGSELQEDTKPHIEDDRKFLESGDYWEYFEDERKWFSIIFLQGSSCVAPLKRPRPEREISIQCSSRG